MINKDKNLAEDTVKKGSLVVEETRQNKGKILRGIVVSDKQDKTATVEVVNFVKNPKYGKFVKRNKKYKAHDEKNQYKKGDRVVIRECRPISKDKTFIVESKDDAVLKNN